MSRIIHTRAARAIRTIATIQPVVSGPAAIGSAVTGEPDSGWVVIFLLVKLVSFSPLAPALTTTWYRS